LDSTQDFRLFIALTVPDAVKGTIQKAQEELRRVVPEKAARWTRREQFHLTLKFLGNVPASRVEELVELIRLVCEAFPPLRLRAARIGFFPDARFPRVVWVGMSDLQNRLAALCTAVQSATQPFTKEAPESEFTGHVTLARVKRLQREPAKDLARSAGRFENTMFGEWTVDQIELMRSELLMEGARHSLLAALPLLGRQVQIKGESSA
jgi:RNA 2',3'-cyclic 3'-phosphodiesterase